MAAASTGEQARHVTLRQAVCVMTPPFPGPPCAAADRRSSRFSIAASAAACQRSARSTRPQAVWLAHGAGMLDGEAVLPGFSCPLADVLL